MVVEVVGEGDHSAVKIERVKRVRPATKTARKEPMFLTSCDLVCRSYPYINRIFFFNGRCEDEEVGEEEGDKVVRKMEEGLAKVLVNYYPLAGRLSQDGLDGRLQVECNDEGVELVEASCELPFSLLACDGFQYRSLFWKLARRTSLLRSDYVQEPLLSIQITRFSEGGLAVGVSMSHTVADAQSFYDFVRALGESCRGVPMSVPPNHMRTALSVNALFPAEKVPCHIESTCLKEEAFSKNGIQGELSKEAFSKNGIQGELSKDSTELHDEKLEEQLMSGLRASKVLQKGDILVDELATELRQMGILKKAFAVMQQHPKLPMPIMEKQMEDEEHRRPRTDLVQKVFSFSCEMLQRLKGKANEQSMGTSLKEDLRTNGTLPDGVDDKGSVRTPSYGYTTFEAFCAHWWRCFIRARRLPPAQPVFLLIPINCRQRFLDIPQGYFGNALDGGMVRLTAGELCGAELGAIAGKIHEAITAATEARFREYIREVERKGNAIPHFDRTGLFHIVDSPKYPIYDTDFGFGTPEAVRAEGFRFGAEVQILAGRHGPGGYDLFCALDCDTMCTLDHDPSFLSCS